MADRVHIGPLTFDVTGAGGYIFTNLVGWESGAPFRTESNPRPNSDGEFDRDRELRGGRVFTFTGGIVGDSIVDAQAKKDAVAALQPDGVPILFARERDWGTRYATVSIMDVPEIVDIDAGLVASVQIQMLARDPVKYGETSLVVGGVSTSGGGLQYPLEAAGVLEYGANGNLGRITLSNLGTSDVWPDLTVSGGLTAGFYLQRLDTGDVLRYDRVVPLGGTVTLISSTGEVLVDGSSDGATYLTRDDWFAVPAGGSIEVQLNAIGGYTGTPQVSATRRDGFR